MDLKQLEARLKKKRILSKIKLKQFRESSRLLDEAWEQLDNIQDAEPEEHAELTELDPYFK